jgi:outer membrane lipoprotein carrier protein
MLNRTEITRGNVQIKKPGKMKWVYNSPDPQVLISDQKNLWLYIPEEEQVTKMPIESVYSSNSPALFLAGQAILTDIFNVVQVLTEKDKFVAVFTPKEVESSLSRLVLRANKNSYQITGATVYDKLGNKTAIKFRSIRINEEIPESVFNFEVPAGVEIQDFTPSP